ncbi:MULTISPECIES: TIGR03016 family PEP-CTERM system-associated outer membrane protein [unclassified Thioalkalivibrio]|uniref:TIGR03016 family PEP-CTERM system-associated outer membrane protein n=1 Tax=unclassified Thioalkalivibrio TaxID=2621013 RepID=UPI000368A6EE|nr:MULTISPECIES: TIGR03016 family PEP-CTERM system-associated outer membrane protein [unclassified Thioalkalivibrio]
MSTNQGRVRAAYRREAPARNGRAICLVAVLGGGTLALPASGLATEWDFTPRVTVGVEATDNVRLAPRGQEDADLIGHARPGFTLRRDGVRNDTRVDYQLNHRTHLSESSEDRTTHMLRARNQTEVIEDTFFVDVTASRREQATSLLDPVGIGGSTPRSNIEETSYYSVSPNLQNEFGTFARQDIRYTYDERHYHRSNRASSTGNRAEYTLDSGPTFDRVFWQLAGFYDRLKYEDGLEGEFSEISATLGYNIGRTLRVFGVVGEEFNDYETLRDENDGSFWEVGVGWTPTPVTSVEARYGERFFGTTRALSATHRSRRASYSVSYTEGITSTRDRREFQAINMADLATGIAGLAERAELEGMTFDEWIDQNPEAAFGVIDSAVVSQEALVEGFYLTRSVRANWRYDTGLSVFGVTAYQTRREAEFDTGVGLFEDDNRRTGVIAFWELTLGPRTTTELSSGVSRTEFLGSDREDDFFYFRASLNRQFAPDLRGSLSYRYQQRDSNSRVNEYRENSIIALITKEF